MMTSALNFLVQGLLGLVSLLLSEIPSCCCSSSMERPHHGHDSSMDSFYPHLLHPWQAVAGGENEIPAAFGFSTRQRHKLDPETEKYVTYWTDDGVPYIFPAVKYQLALNASRKQKKSGKNQAVSFETDAQKSPSGSPQRIVRGKDASPGQFPFIARLHLVKAGRHLCGGTLIHPNWVLTAAHCMSTEQCPAFPKPGLHNDVADVLVILGDHNTTANETTEQRLKIRQAVTHEDWFNLTLCQLFRGDVCLLELESPAKLNDWVQTLPLPDSPDVKPAGVAKAAGWGVFLDSVHERRLPEVLQWTELPLNEVGCKRYFPMHTYAGSHICAGGQGTDVCSGDSGGPLVCNETQPMTNDTDQQEVPSGRNDEKGQGQLYLCGVADAVVGLPCLSFPNAPSLWSNVAHYLPWIRSVIGTDEDEDDSAACSTPTKDEEDDEDCGCDDDHE